MKAARIERILYLPSGLVILDDFVPLLCRGHIAGDDIL